MNKMNQYEAFWKPSRIMIYGILVVSVKKCQYSGGFTVWLKFKPLIDFQIYILHTELFLK